jgi:hypothetical protein
VRRRVWRPLKRTIRVGLKAKARENRCVDEARLPDDADSTMKAL